MTADRSASQWGASVLLLVAAATHVPLIPDHLEEAPYVGVLFILLSATCVALAATVMVLDRDAVWLLSGAVCLAALVAFLASRTVGLPQLGDDIGMWTEEPMGVPALASEALVVALAALHLRRRTHAPTVSTPTHAAERNLR